MTFTLNEIALILVALVIGAVIGLMISGRGRYKRLWREEKMAHQRAIQHRAEEVRTSPAITTPVATHPRRDRAQDRDDLTRISTISAKDERTLNEAGYHRYSQIAALNDEQEASLEARLGCSPGLIAQDDWREQARLLDTGQMDEHQRRYNGHRTTG